MRDDHLVVWRTSVAAVGYATLICGRKGVILKDLEYTSSSNPSHLCLGHLHCIVSALRAQVARVDFKISVGIMSGSPQFTVVKGRISAGKPADQSFPLPFVQHDA